MDKIKLGFVPTRRSIFSAPDAIKYRGLTADRLREIGVEIVDIDDINDEGLLFDDSHIAPIVEKFRAEGVDGIMLCHANFGTEYVCARLARELGLPVLLWGPRDERPEPDGTRLRDSQCGLFATGKVLRRFQVPFTYMTNCRLTDPEFERGVWDFLAVCNVVKTFKHTRILLFLVILRQRCLAQYWIEHYVYLTIFHAYKSETCATLDNILIFILHLYGQYWRTSSLTNVFQYMHGQVFNHFSCQSVLGKCLIRHFMFFYSCFHI